MAVTRRAGRMARGRGYHPTTCNGASRASRALHKTTTRIRLALFGTDHPKTNTQEKGVLWLAARMMAPASRA